MDFHVPVAEGVVTSPWGPRKDPITGADAFHHGIDFGKCAGKVILAAAEGILVDVGTSDIRGNYVVLKHSDGTSSEYWHMKDSFIKKTGLLIRARQALGTVGETGRAKGPHLHFGVKNAAGQWIDPGPLLGLTVPVEGAAVKNLPWAAALVVALIFF